MVNARIGCNVEIQGEHLKLYRDSPFMGQINNIFIFDDALSPTQISSIYSLGPNYNGCFQERYGIFFLWSLMFLQSSMNPQKNLYVEKNLFLAYNVRVKKSLNFIEISSRHVMARHVQIWHLTQVLRSMPNFRTWHFVLPGWEIIQRKLTKIRDVKDIMRCLGGIQVLFPLFAQLDQPLALKSPNSPIDYSVDGKGISDHFTKF